VKRGKMRRKEEQEGKIFFMACAFFNWCVRVLLDGSAQVCYGGGIVQEICGRKGYGRMFYKSLYP